MGSEEAVVIMTSRGLYSFFHLVQSILVAVTRILSVHEVEDQNIQAFLKGAAGDGDGQGQLVVQKLKVKESTKESWKLRYFSSDFLQIQSVLTFYSLSSWR